MSTPKHRTAPGSSYFVTTKCWQGRAVFQVREAAEILIQTLFEYRDRNIYLVHEFVIMPDHLHLLLTPSHAISLEKAIQFVKGGSSHRIHKHRGQKIQIWQVGFHDWTVRDYADWQVRVECIHNNSVRAKLVEQPQDWPYSSATGRFTLDPIPAKFLELSSGAKAKDALPPTPGLKPRPPKEHANVVPKRPSPKSTLAKAANL